MENKRAEQTGVVTCFFDLVIWMIFNEIEERDWLDNPLRCLDQLQHHNDFRRLRLFGCACFQRRYEPITDTEILIALEMIYRYADRTIDPSELSNIKSQIRNERKGRSHEFIEDITFLLLPDGCTSSHPGHMVSRRNWGNESRRQLKEIIPQTTFLHDIFGNPFLPITFNPVWLTPTVKRLAQTAYEERRFDLMPILADALEEAGCDNADILDHCRTFPVHVLGCWVVDKILGKE